MNEKQIRPDRVATYVRWSTDEQTGNTTLEVQLEGCKHYILSQGWQVNEHLIFIDDGYTGGNLNRPAMKRLRKAIKDGLVDCVVVYKLDRLSRNVKDTVNLVLDEWDGITYFKSACESVDTISPMGKQIFYLLVSFAEWERSVIKERTQGGRLKRAKDGWIPGSKAPYGYKNGEITGTYEIVEHEAKIVQDIFNKYVMGIGMAAIASELNEQGIKSSGGGAWGVPAIRWIIQNESYMGTLTYGKVSLNPKYKPDSNTEPYWIKNNEYISVDTVNIPAIISRELFDMATNIRMSKNVKISGFSGRCAESDHLLSSLLKCKHCGSSWAGKKVKGRKARYYFCTGKASKGTSVCSCTYINQDLLNGYVINQIKQKFLTEKGKQGILSSLQTKYQERISNLQNLISIQEDEIKSNEGKLARINKDYLNEKIDADTFNSFKRELTQNNKEAFDTIVNKKEELEGLKDRVIDTKTIEEISSRITGWDTLDIQTQKFILRQWIEVIWIDQVQDELNVEIVYKWDLSLEGFDPKPNQQELDTQSQRFAG